MLHQKPLLWHLVDKKTLVMNTYKHIIEGCRRGHRDAQQQLYVQLSPLLMGICRRYMRNTHDAEDILVLSFVKIFENIKKYSGKGSFEGWARRITVNECLMEIRKNHAFHLSIEHATYVAQNEVDVHDSMSYDELISLLDELPDGYKTIFNLYVIEGYKHKEIADLLNISINTSKSQLIHAKKRMKDLITKRFNQKLG